MASDKSKHVGNNVIYSIENTDVIDDSLKGNTILFLGSSVTLGHASLHEAFPDYLSKMYGLTSIKEAISGTTLVDETNECGESYVTRLKKLDPNLKLDMVVCQLSTNDATRNKPLGTLGDNNPLTITGALEEIIKIVNERYHCPILIYTGTKYESILYEEMVEMCYKLVEKWNIYVLDLFHHEMNNISKELYDEYMYDPIHPARKGYKLWWTPQFYTKIKEILNGSTRNN